MSWTEALAIASGLLSFVVLLGSALGRETVGELKRRVTAVELEVRGQTAATSAHSASIGKLEERTNGMTSSLARIEEQMVPRSEWEARHTSTDRMLMQILNRIEGRDSQVQIEQPPPRMSPRRG